MVLLGLIILFLGVTLNIKFSDTPVNTNIWHVWLYKRLWYFEHDYNLPTNVCNYFWKYLLGIFLLPFNITIILLGLFWKKVREEVDNCIVAFYSLYTYIIYLIYLSIAFSNMNPDFSTFTIFEWIWKIEAGIGIMSCIIAFIYLQKLYNDKNINEVKKKNILVQRFRNWKSKSCTKINWK